MPTVKATPAAKFYDTVGVNTHLSYTAYKSDIDRVLRCLDTLGVAHCRDLNFATRTDQWDRLKRVMKEGYKYCLMTTTDLGSINEQLRVFASDPSGISLIEGSNEDDITEFHRYDGNPDRRQPGNSGPGFPEGTRAWTRDLYKAVKSHPGLKHLGVVGPSFARSKSFNVLGDLSAYCDYGNTHSYTSDGDPPGAYRAGNIAEVQKIARGKPYVATEGGYHTATGVKTGNLGLTLDVHAKYMTRFYLEQYQHGWYRTYVYELMDNQNPRPEQREQNWGLFFWDGKPKPAGAAIGAMMSILKDDGAPVNHPTSSLDYTLTGMPGSGQQLLFQKRNGTFYLVLWNEVKNWKVGAGGFNVADVPITLTIAKTIKSIRFFRPVVNGKSPTSLNPNDGSYKLGLPDSPLIVEIDLLDAGETTPDDDKPKPPPVKPAEPEPVKVDKTGDGTNTIFVECSGSSVQGPPVLEILVNDQVVKKLDVTALHISGDTQEITVYPTASLNGKTVGVRFSNDLYVKGQGDRNIWLSSVKIRGAEMLSGETAMHSNGTLRFTPPTNPGNDPGSAGEPAPASEGAKSVALEFTLEGGKRYALLMVDGKEIKRVLMAK